MIILVLLALPFLGWFLFTSIFDALFGYKKPSKDVYITHHHHYYDQRQVHINQQTKDQEYLNQ